MTAADNSRALIDMGEVRKSYNLGLPSEAEVLHGVSLHLPAGHTLGLVGPTGAGKSTLLKLLLRQWAPQEGVIHWGEHALADYTLAALRAGIAWVPQEAFLFSASVAEIIWPLNSSPSRQMASESVPSTSWLFSV